MKKVIIYLNHVEKTVGTKFRNVISKVVTSQKEEDDFISLYSENTKKIQINFLK